MNFPNLAQLPSSKGTTNSGFCNWSGSVKAQPHAFYQPATIAEVQQIVRQLPAGQSVRTVGAGHSFSPAAAGEQVMMNLDKLSGIVNVDADTKRVRLLAGTRLRNVPDLLEPFGLALTNQGDVDPQSVAGAISTSTHGTGISYTGFAGTVTGLTLVDASGELRRYDIDEDPELLRLVTVSIGALGVVVEVEMQCVDTFDLLAEETSEDFEEVLDTFLERSRAVDHFECYWFPHSTNAMTKSNTRLAPDQPAPGGEPPHRSKLRSFIDDELISNGVFAAALQLGKVKPSLIPSINRISADAMSRSRYRARAHKVFVAPRRVRFHEMEYAVPIEAGPDTVREIRRTIDRKNWRVPFPLELRTTAADDVALSTANGRESMYIAIHAPHFSDPTALFADLEPILRAAGGRPHWGKMHTLGAAELSELYPRFGEFVALRDQMDPQRSFGSQYLSRVFE